MTAETTVLTIAYDGSSFAGFARQPSVETVQGRLEAALETVLRRQVETVGAGRTDAGVHALAQVVSFAAREGDPDPIRLARSVSALAGPEIVVREVRMAREGFSARHDALSRQYRYRLALGSARPVFVSRYAWWLSGSIDLGGMREGAACLLGRHDFRSFCVAESADTASTMRELDLLELEEGTDLGERVVSLTVEGRSFLHSMVRIIVGTLVEVGAGRRSPEWVGEVLEARDRRAAGQTAPPQGLSLWAVSYPADVWRGP